MLACLWRDMTVRLVVCLICVLSLFGCAGASEGKRRGRFAAEPTLTSCAADCLVWNTQRTVCMEYHAWTSERCIELLTASGR